MNLKQYLTQDYLFKYNSAFVNPQEKLFVLAGIILVLLAVVLKISSVLAPTPVDKKVRSRFYRLFLTIGLSLAGWYLCRYENAMFFGTHFVVWLVVLIGLIWLGFILVSIIKNYRQEKNAWGKEQVKLKYLPK